jgi:uncharacterized Zn-binding protein involved in type VI secretion
MAKDRSALPVMRQGQAMACPHWAPVIAADPAAPVERLPAAATGGVAGETAADAAALGARVEPDS